MIKSIEKLKVRIDQNLNRAEKSEALSEDVVKIEAKITSLKQVSDDADVGDHVCPKLNLF